MAKKVSESIASGIEIAVEEALANIEKPKRKRRTKAEIEAARAEEQAKEFSRKETVLKYKGKTHITAVVDWDQDKGDDTILPYKVQIPDSVINDKDYDEDTIGNYLSNATGYCFNGYYLEWPDRYEDFDEYCQWELEKAKIYNKEKPDFDFRNFYEKGNKVFFVRYHEERKTKEIHQITLRTIYPRMIIGVVSKQYCECIGFDERDNIFIGREEAMDYFNSIDAEVEVEYDENKKKKKKYKSTDTEDIDEQDIDIDEQTDEDE